MKVSAGILFLGVAVFCSLVAGADGSVIYLRFSDSESLDPGKTTTHYSGEVVANIFEGLVRYKRNRSPRIRGIWT